MMKNMLLFLTLGMVLLLGGCAKCTDCGRIKQSTDAARQITSVTISPDYNYYTYKQGSNRSPMAILGVDTRFTIKTTLWKKTDLQPDMLSAWVRDYQQDRGTWDDINNIPIHYKGWSVLDPNGEQIGIYYSTFEWLVLKFPGNNVIELGRPQPSQLQTGLRRFAYVSDNSWWNSEGVMVTYAGPVLQ